MDVPTHARSSGRRRSRGDLILSVAAPLCAHRRRKNQSYLESHKANHR